MMKLKLLFFIFLPFFLGCRLSEHVSNSETAEANPAAEGFNAEASDEKAIRIADEVMEAMGGRKNWDDTRFIAWNFFGRRWLLWDKHSGDIRIESPSDSMVYLLNAFNDSGSVMKKGEELTHPDSLNKYLERGKAIWINDSYWLVMPFKLKDSGVTLQYLREDTTQVGKTADVLQLTFKEVGNTPENKYLVYADKETHLITQWDYYQKASDEKERFSLPWLDYKRYGNILLSGDRGGRHLTDIAVYENVPEGAFTSFAPLDL